LNGPIAAGNWHLVGDVEVIGSGDVQYDFIWRRGGTDTTLVTFTHHFDPLDGSYGATEYDADADGIAAAAAPGDQLVWRWSIPAGPPAGQYVAVPNGDGFSSNGRFPSITFPGPPGADD
jgi:hypothetical protein